MKTVGKYQRTKSFAPYKGLQILDSSLCQWNFDSGSQSLESGIPDSLNSNLDSKT